MATQEENKKGFFKAMLEEGELVMEPYCECGELLDEEYNCESCHEHCLCLEVRCDSQPTLERVQQFIDHNERFGKFKAVLVG